MGCLIVVYWWIFDGINLDEIGTARNIKILSNSILVSLEASWVETRHKFNKYTIFTYRWVRLELSKCFLKDDQKRRMQGHIRTDGEMQTGIHTRQYNDVTRASWRLNNIKHDSLFNSLPSLTTKRVKALHYWLVVLYLFNDDTCPSRHVH